VSHLKQRKEKHCLNCNAVTHGRYCSVCGQENLEPQETVWHLITHIFNDITHFDGKFFSSLKYIVTKPGFLSAEYVAGRRMAYLNPVRFYLFTSFLFFLILFSFFMNGKGSNGIVFDDRVIPKKDSLNLIDDFKEEGLDSNQIKRRVASYIDSVRLIPKKNRKGNNNAIFHFEDYKDRHEYDSLTKAGKIDAGFFERKLLEKQFQLQEKYGEDRGKQVEALKENITHYTPQILFLSLPFFALLLKLFYIRRKKFYYVAHVIFTIHFYIFVYIQILLINIVSKIADITAIGLIHDLTILLGLGIIYYGYRAMRTFYEQSRGKTIAKLIILTIALVFLFIFFATLLIGFSLYKM
jgi:hypothetical protein